MKDYFRSGRHSTSRTEGNIKIYGNKDDWLSRLSVANYFRYDSSGKEGNDSLGTFLRIQEDGNQIDEHRLART